ncbi:bifunctional ADP-dependent NAD(P)H-hydrate dehydratase/NAD(P)H-hydrate epimerase [Paraburkholderia phymatum]|uniref:Bifunctional NAD(P)H-hydrate repair enzyme n=1 Tax=Paraburkholderia phymatum (strain DSM 17167 / CIP 108236 / LMG 21445 / STM815) TaxID=391038 RepID=B2JGM4_PARP8|nr:bifunctional ADP-dependent NAD(P)H-hydrate dehydratase/NAD(P)H-hydrate epimerase [Paraburkholderia phymatum]ACC70209.1 carbohydrate kinase, YjeF related protein [Paraburkholderia phymatum STM815]
MTDAPLAIPSLPPAQAVLINPYDRPFTLLSVAELRALEQDAGASLPAHTLMGRAGHAGARFLLEHIAHDGSADPYQPVWLVAGPGNNGGDALVVAAELRRAGVAVEVCMPVEVRPDDARWALTEARAAGVAISNAVPASFDRYGWVVDGMFGIGLARRLEGVFESIATQLSARAKTRGRVLALDVPSGLDSDTGNVVEGGVAVRATNTVTFIGAKPGLFMSSGRDLAGDVTVAPIGVEGPRQPAVRLNGPALFVPYFPPRDFSTHKGTFGSLAVVGGDTGMCGAPILAARAALFAGAGKVHVAFLGAGSPPYDPPHPELMLHPLDELPLATMDALSIGCGMGKRERAVGVLRDVLRLKVPTLLDADALNLVAHHAELAAAVKQRGETGNDPCVLTPHPLEAARLLGSDAKSVQRDRLAAARELAARYACVAVLKGTGTVIAAADGRVCVNPTGNAALATGGTGDVLGGLIGALLSQGLPHYEAALAGVYLHGLAAEKLTVRGRGPAGLTAGELAPMVRKLLNRLVYPLRD